MARKPWVEPQNTTATALEAPTDRSWLVFADASGLGDDLVSQLRASGVRCRVVHRGTTFAIAKNESFTLRAEAPVDWVQLLQACAEEAPDRFVFLWTLDETDPGEAMLSTDALFHLTQALEVIGPAAKLRLDVITRGAQAIGKGNVISLAQGPSIGLMRVIANEHNNFTCRGIDLPIEASATDNVLLWNELQEQDIEREIAFRGEARYVRRITRGLEPREQVLDRSMPLRLESRERGLLDALRLVPFALPPCGAGEVVIEVRAAGMNFRDVLKALALYPAETADARIFGDEVAGVVKTVGADVTHVKAGDRVFGLAVFGLATDSMARAGNVRLIPDVRVTLRTCLTQRTWLTAECSIGATFMRNLCRLT
jgi:hypothetical protein